jgi:hypothetical protein
VLLLTVCFQAPVIVPRGLRMLQARRRARHLQRGLEITESRGLLEFQTKCKAVVVTRWLAARSASENTKRSD